ncbi:TPA: ParB/RepB/Spo0J family partition protein [Klebsiella pneumoniae]|jgi:ParB family chromosome partitioning protein|uniref:ParB/RepB/Spo0J family partition protein n=1 Tax=Enterobacteriaceae TaxID=543 RepID=UPI0012C5EF87|nr:MULTISPECIES: KorB domain-containing protein [Enterobacteriaceae]EBO0058352.1 chromosome partitioning protein ParB [Salmonella enterica]EDZ1538633.1 ParB/RepB/Spo0J family partition protein [Salmonella enterica subsp. enterica serovar Derby]EEX4872095.1 ParB/RepB/Spo0J family partition protein [Salmonella enterica subsp. enterica serovar 4,[5],12:i:-]EKO3705129.1 ParB/RepB/Spo0J family partition protein [Vibrio metschnikovii]HBX6772001.1 ParB/RepB/Spo0J family partition protein [Klebsiella 
MALNNLRGLSDLAKAAKGKKGKEVLTVPVDDVVSKVQVRKRFRNIEELAATMLTEGQQSPIIVFPKNEEGKFVIQKGERRWRACKHAGIDTIDLVVNDKVQNNLDETAGELIENIQRDDLTPVEIAEALNLFIEDGWKQKDIADRLGKNITFVSTHLSLLKLPDCVRELYDNEVCSDTETLNNLRLLFDMNEERCRAVCAVAMSDGITRKQSRELLNDAKRIKEEMEKGPLTGSGHNDEPGDGNTDDQTLNSNGNGTEEQLGNTEQNHNQNVLEDGSDRDGLNDDDLDPLLDEEDKEPVQQPINSGKNKDEGGDALPPLPKDKEWKNVRADSLVIAVNVNLDGETKRGVIMTDRVALVPSTAWVKTLDSEGKEKHVHVPVSDIELLSVEG